MESALSLVSPVRFDIRNAGKIMILACTSLTDYVDAAQKKMGTDYPVIPVDRKFHATPEIMKMEIDRIFKELPEKPDTLLVSMGFCGGTWDHVSFPCRAIIPRADDCVSLLLAVDNQDIPNRKELGHLYVYEKNADDSMMLSIIKDLSEGHFHMLSHRKRKHEPTQLEIETQMHIYFDNYHHLDIIDTGLNSCYEEAYVEKAQDRADLIHADLDFVPGSNILLEKLVSGQWDGQFVTAEPGHIIRQSDFFD